MTEIQRILFENQDKKYAIFQANLTPNVSKDLFIGVRVPKIREIAKSLYKKGEYQEFLHSLPHTYYDENMLHGILISLIKEYDVVIQELENFLPYVDNWAVCDTMNPKIFKKHKDVLLGKIQEWMKSNHTYTCRFGMGLLMGYFLDEDFKEEYLKWVCKVHSEEYYVNMMIAWYMATALTKQWNATIPVIESHILDPWTHNKSIQKAIESRVIPEERKNYLRSLKRKH